MSEEVKGILANYDEEKQKLDLKLKIEEARQRTALQRKLFEKKKLKQKQKTAELQAHGSMHQLLPVPTAINAVPSVDSSNSLIRGGAKGLSTNSLKALLSREISTAQGQRGSKPT